MARKAVLFDLGCKYKINNISELPSIVNRIFNS